MRSWHPISFEGTVSPALYGLRVVCLDRPCMVMKPTCTVCFKLLNSHLSFEQLFTYYTRYMHKTCFFRSWRVRKLNTVWNPRFLLASAVLNPKQIRNGFFKPNSNHSLIHSGGLANLSRDVAAFLIDRKGSAWKKRKVFE